MPSRPGTASGFTLIEMLVVLVVLGVVVGVVVARGPARSQTLDLRAVAGEIAETLRVGRTRAIAGNRPVTFTIDLAQRRFFLDGTAPRPLPAGLDVVVRAAAGEADGPRQLGISFLPDGSATGGVIALGVGARRMQVLVSWLTGRVSVTDETR